MEEKVKTAKMEFENFIIEPDSVCQDRFNLYKKGIGKKGKVEGKETINNIGYGYTFRGVLEKIASIRTAENKEVTTIKGYLEEYKRQIGIISSALI